MSKGVTGVGGWRESIGTCSVISIVFDVDSGDSEGVAVVAGSTHFRDAFF